jgi:hypothetical protein
MAVGGCGSTSTTVSTTVASNSGIVSVVVSAPTSGSVINADSVTVRGTVTPANAAVMVQGRAAAVGNGIFSANANLHAGKTTIDVIGSAPGAAPGSTSITITRQAQGTAAAQPPAASGAGAGSGGATPDIPHAQAGSGSSGQTACGGGLSVGPNTTCAFAQNVEAAYRNNGPGTVSVFSPVTNQTYDMTCNSQSSRVVCTGGNNASVYFP